MMPYNIKYILNRPPYTFEFIFRSQRNQPVLLRNLRRFVIEMFPKHSKFRKVCLTRNVSLCFRRSGQSYRRCFIDFSSSSFKQDNPYVRTYVAYRKTASSKFFFVNTLTEFFLATYRDKASLIFYSCRF